jgi:arylsulfatase A-like enzyme
MTTAWGWGISLFLVAMGARVSLAVLHALDNGWALLATPWFLLTFLVEDVELAFAFAALAAGLDQIGRSAPSQARRCDRVTLALFMALTFWIVLNIPVARFFSTPLTYSLLHATGSALEDSIAGYLSVSNVGLPILIWIGGRTFAFQIRPLLRPSRRWVYGSTAALIVVLACYPFASRRVDTLGLHRNAVFALLETTLARWRPNAATARPTLTSAACAPVNGPPGTRATQGTTTDASSLPTGVHDLVGLARRRSVIWVILESTRARVLSAYGGSPEVMPHIEALASQALIFENAYTVYPESIKGLFSVLCSREPGVASEASDYAVGRVPCRPIANQMADAGYRTGLFHSGWFAYLGMRAVVEGRGFDTLHDAATITSPFRTSFGVDDNATADRMLQWVDTLAKDQPFFALFMPIAGHHPYHAPGGSPRPFPDREDADAYANDLHVADAAFGRLREGLRARGRDEGTVYVVFGDHGEAFREHPGNVAHALFLYEENVRVPLLVAVPGVLTSNRRIAGMASLIDVAPTTLALAGIRIPRQYEGRSLLDQPAKVARFATEQAVRRVGLRDGRWKFIWDEDSRRAQLFDLETDPTELQNLASAEPHLVERYRACVTP